METLILLLFFLLGSLFLLKLIYLITAGCAFPFTRGALFVPTSPVNIKAFLDALPMKRQDLFVDLGCGDGRILVEARKRYKVHAIGLEVNPFAYLSARLRILGKKGLEVKLQNFWKKDLRHADVVFCYLFPDVMKDLGAKLKNELSQGSKVVSCNFPIPEWHPSTILHPHSDRNSDPIYVYSVPESWCSPAPQGLLSATLNS